MTDSMSRKHIDLLDFYELPAPVYFRYADFDTHEYASAHRHPWGTLEYSSSGVLHMEIGSSRFMSPPQYAVWVPPQVEHSFYSHQPVNYRAVCLDPKVCADLPRRACTLAISDILKAILKDFAARDVKIPEQDADVRLAQVLVDQLQQAPEHACYLPYASSPGLLGILEALGSARSIQEIAFDLGYSSGSAFIAMFQRQAGCTPEQYRRSHLDGRKV